MQKFTRGRWCALAFSCTTLAFTLNAQTVTTRNITEFVNAQGTYNLVGYPSPVAMFIGWGDPAGRQYSADYAGLVKRCWPGLPLATSFDGTITERPLSDGRAEVHVILHTANAVTWVADQDFATGKILFGQRWNTGGTCGTVSSSGMTNPVLGDFFMQVVFTNTAPGAGLPDLVQLIYAPLPGQEIHTIKLSAKAVGPLYNLPGITDGTIGMASTEQIALLYKTKGHPAKDGFAVERIDLKPIGK